MFALFALVALSAEPEPINRLDLARTWEAAQLFHPSMVHRESVVDEGFVAAVKALDAAKTREERIAAVGLILAPLRDPSTRVFKVHPVTPGPMVEEGPVRVIHAARVPNTADFWGLGATIKLVGDATRVVIDLRGATVDNPVIGLEVFPPTPITLPAVQYLTHAGFDSRHPSIYSTRLEQVPGETLRADPDAAKRRFAIVLNPEDPIPDWAIAQREAGLAVFVSEGELTNDGALMSTSVTLGDGVTARIRAAEYVNAAGLISTDVRVPKGKDAITVAKDALKSGAKPKKSARGAMAVEPLRRFELGAVDAKFPDREHRMLGGLRLWMISRRFWAYPHLRTADPDEQLFELLARLEDTLSPQTYRDAISETAVLLLPDSHVRVNSETLLAATASPPFTVTWLEDQPVVTAVTGDAGRVRRGDVIDTIDGEKLTIRVNERMRVTPGSRVDSRRQTALEEALRRAPGKHVLSVRHTVGSGERTDVVWEKEDAEQFEEPRVPPPHFKVLEGNIGFIDLVNLEPEEVDAAMEELKDTEKLIIDVRGYPKGTAFELGPRLGPEPRIAGVASFCVPVVRARWSETDRLCEAWLQQLPVWRGPRYRKPVIALINLDTISQAEHSCLILDAYTDVTFIGSPTTGANGNVSRVALPGGLTVTFTGAEVKHADGRQLQMMGIVPKITVRPTLAGFRDRTDEVLERALTFARTGK